MSQWNLLPKILSPTLSKLHLSAELPAIILFMKIPDTKESPDTLTYKGNKNLLEIDHF